MDRDYRTIWNYHFRLTDIIVPYLGGFIGLAWNDRDATGAIGPQGGVKFFVHDVAFLNLGYRYEWFFNRFEAIDDNKSRGNHVFNIGVPGAEQLGVESLSVFKLAFFTEKRARTFPQRAGSNFMTKKIGSCFIASDPLDRHLISSHLQQLKDLHAAARALRVTAFPVEIKGSDNFDYALTTIKNNRPEGLLVLGGGMGNLRRRILDSQREADWWQFIHMGRG